MNPTFLYIEDDPLSCEVMLMMLTGLGYTGLTIFNDSENFMARARALEPLPDVIFLDVHIEPHNGFEMLKTFRGFETFKGRTIIAVTASVMNEEVDQLRDAGFNGAIGKPLDFDNFPSLLERLLAGEQVWSIL